MSQVGTKSEKSYDFWLPARIYTSAQIRKCAILGRFRLKQYQKILRVEIWQLVVTELFSVLLGRRCWLSLNIVVGQVVTEYVVIDAVTDNFGWLTVVTDNCCWSMLSLNNCWSMHMCNIVANSCRLTLFLIKCCRSMCCCWINCCRSTFVVEELSGSPLRHYLPRVFP